MHKRIIKLLILGILICLVLIFSIYKYKIGPVDRSNKDTVMVDVHEGDTYYTLADKLEEKKLIKSVKWYKIYIKMFRINKLETGRYVLDQTMSVKDIVNILKKGSNLSEKNVSITFREGLNIRQIAQLIEKNTTIKSEDFIETLTDKEYINKLIDKYWFLSDEILNDKIYYPLEGYLYPDTYEFMVDSASETIIETMLDNFSKKLKDYENKITTTGYTIHQLITMSSIVELEAGNATDRAKVSKVFYNRLNKSGETLGSDITAYYGAKMDDWSNGLGDAEYDCNGYNTRLNSKCPITGLPVGPVCNPSIESIESSINPDNSVDSSYLFFVADCSGKTYLTKTYQEHQKTIENLKSTDNWCDN